MLVLFRDTAGQERFRTITTAYYRGAMLAIEHNIKFMETSAVSSINVEEAFYTLARDIKEKMERKVAAQAQPKPTGGHLHSIEPTRKRSRFMCTIL
ncbi:hypothetical protein HPB48_012421 [Haemaphysalis longicornis]|uniref:Uncharacterized protein n=1 Tax=Haemaphysalis longicornis TaxID=44386 RepID=A0A9J6G2R6_HAELO|nr:hypothetical protein HPB48_012421 [Haemaphysalis longicornis]